MITRATYTGDS